MRKALRVAAIGMIAVGVLLLAEVAVTLAWKEPFSAIVGEIRQNEAERDLQRRIEAFRPGSAEAGGESASPRQRAARFASRLDATAEEGEPLGRLRAPSAGIDTIVVEGTEEPDLKVGPGHYPETSLPGQRRTVGIAGHRTTFGAPFRHIDRFERGDEVVLEMPYGTFTYGVERVEIVPATAVGIVRNAGRERIVLTACHPLYGTSERYAVFADLRDFRLRDERGRPSAGSTPGPAQD